jgi:hypothetical protein
MTNVISNGGGRCSFTKRELHDRAPLLCLPCSPCRLHFYIYRSLNRS